MLTRSSFPSALKVKYVVVRLLLLLRCRECRWPAQYQTLTVSVKVIMQYETKEEDKGKGAAYAISDRTNEPAIKYCAQSNGIFSSGSPSPARGILKFPLTKSPYEEEIIGTY